MAVGSAGQQPGHFKEGGVNASETFMYRPGDHALQAGVSYDHRAVTYDWLPGSAGIYEFGNLAGFVAGQGTFYQASRSAVAPSLTSGDLGIFVQDDWRVAPQMQILFGLRVDYEAVPQGIVANHSGWLRVSGVPNNLTPADVKKYDYGPRAGFMFDVNGNGQTVIQAPPVSFLVNTISRN